MSMLASLMAPRITGRYDFIAVPIALPTTLVEYLVHHAAAPALSLRKATDLSSVAVPAPAAPEGYQWIVIECGKQIGTGMSGVPGGKSDFYEAKLEIPFLKHSSSHASSGMSFTLKQCMLLSAALMVASSSHIVGLRSHKAVFKSSEGSNEVAGWLKIVTEENGEEGWSAEFLRDAVIGGWWVGERTGVTASRFILEPLSRPTKRQVRVHLHIPHFTQLSLDEARKLVAPLKLDDEGWLDLPASGWVLSEATKMEVAKVAAS